MKITRSKKMERKILDKIKAHLNRAPRSQDKWHVSDLLYPLKAYWQRVDPQPMTDLQALYFTAGRAHHGILEAALGKWDKAKQQERADAGEFLKHNIYFSPDLRQPWPWEIKTSRSEYEPKDLAKGFEGYLKQLKSYQAFMEDDRGGLLVFFLGLKEGWRKRPALRFYKVLMNKKEREEKVAEMKALGAALTKAVKTKKHKPLPLCPAWMCNDCPWFKKCKPWLVDPKRKAKGND
jgi:hypothetical protein